jgi:hypothetical protein
MPLRSFEEAAVARLRRLAEQLCAEVVRAKREAEGRK